MVNRRECLAAAVLSLAALGATAQDGTPLKIVVGYPAGDASDVVARLMAEKMRVSLKRPVIVDNRAGAGGMIAAEVVKMAPPDGNTLMLAPLAAMVTFPYTFDRLRYDPIKDFEPVALVATFDLALAVAADGGPRTLPELAQRARNDQTMATFGSPAAGSLPHFFGLLYADAVKVNLLHVPYRGDAPAKQALLSGEVGSMVGPLGSFVEFARAGKLRILATSGPARNPATPDVPTFKELGIDAVATPWFALYAPAKTPKDAVARLSKAALDAVNDPDVKTKLAPIGLDAANVGPDGLAETMKKDQARWSVVIRKSGFKAD